MNPKCYKSVICNGPLIAPADIAQVRNGLSSMANAPLARTVLPGEDPCGSLNVAEPGQGATAIFGTDMPASG